MDRPKSIEPLTADHWDAVRSIYLQGIATGNVTFQQTTADWKEWNAGHLPGCRMVARSGQDILGWAALRLGNMNGGWRDVLLMERRSLTIGA